MLLVIPILYDNSVWTTTNLNILTLALCSAGIFLTILRFSLDLLYIRDTNSKITLHINPSESSGNMIATENQNANDSTINNSFEGLDYQRKHVRKLSGDKSKAYLDPSNGNEFSMHSRTNSGEARMYFPSQRASFNYRENPYTKNQENPQSSAEKNYLQIPSIAPTESKNSSPKPKQISPNHKVKNSKIFNINNLTVKN